MPLRFLSTPSARRATNRRSAGIQYQTISIHALREEGDAGSHFGAREGIYFYPRPPRGGRQNRWFGQSGPEPISIHALREEGDLCQFLHRHNYHNFYPRPPRGGRPAWERQKQPRYLFLSTPSARRATFSAALWDVRIANFYPRPPRGGRPRSRTPEKRADRFLSTPSARRATAGHGARHGGQPISIHALREEGDCAPTAGYLILEHFYPRPPRGGRP